MSSRRRMLSSTANPTRRWSQVSCAWTVSTAPANGRIESGISTPRKRDRGDGHAPVLRCRRGWAVPKATTANKRATGMAWAMAQRFLGHGVWHARVLREGDASGNDRCVDEVGRGGGRVPQLAREFERRGLDYCCVGRVTLCEACALIGLDPWATIAELSAAAATSGSAKWTTMTADVLVDHRSSCAGPSNRSNPPKPTSPRGSPRVLSRSPASPVPTCSQPARCPHASTGSHRSSRVS